MNNFDLTNEKWIPCISLTRDYGVYSLRDVFAQAATLREVYGDTPLVTVALYRFLLAVLHSVARYKVQEPSEWLALWQKNQFEVNDIFAYLDKWSERFYLFHEQYPFYQDRDTSGGKPDPKEERDHDYSKRIATLMHEIASGNNAAWFDHTVKTDNFAVDAPTAARAILAAQSFGLGGTGASDGNFRHALLVNDVVFVVQGDNLFETLMLNLYLYQNGDPLPEKDDRPIWEHDTPLESRKGLAIAQDAKGEHHPGGYLDLLTWPSRRILLKRDEDGKVRWLKMDQGWELHADEKSEDPMKVYKKNIQVQGKGKKKFEVPAKSALGWDENRALWRDSTALFRLRAEYVREDSKTAFHAPIIIRNLRRLQKSSNGILPKSKMYHCAAFGMCAGPTSAQPKAAAAAIHFFRSESLPLPLAFLADDNQVLVEKFDDLLRMAEQRGARLVQALRVMADYFLQPNEESRKNDKTITAAQDALTDWELFLAALDESQQESKKVDLEKRQNERDDRFPQRKGIRAGAERRYWATVGERFYQAITDLATKSPDDKQEIAVLVSDWKSSVWSSAYQAYEESASALGDTPRALKAYALGFEILEGRFNKSNQKKEEMNEPTRQSKRSARSRNVSRKAAR